MPSIQTGGVVDREGGDGGLAVSMAQKNGRVWDRGIFSGIRTWATIRKKPTPRVNSPMPHTSSRVPGVRGAMVMLMTSTMAVIGSTAAKDSLIFPSKADYAARQDLLFQTMEIILLYS